MSSFLYKWPQRVRGYHRDEQTDTSAESSLLSPPLLRRWALHQQVPPTPTSTRPPRAAPRGAARPAPPPPVRREKMHLRKVAWRTLSGRDRSQMLDWTTARHREARCAFFLFFLVRVLRLESAFRAVRMSPLWSSGNKRLIPTAALIPSNAFQWDAACWRRPRLSQVGFVHSVFFVYFRLL